MDHLGDNVDSKFRFVLLAARRADQLMRGARPRVVAESSKTARIAMEEIRHDKIEWGYGPKPEVSADEAAGEGAEAQVAAADVH